MFLREVLWYEMMTGECINHVHSPVCWQCAPTLQRYKHGLLIHFRKRRPPAKKAPLKHTAGFKREAFKLSESE